MTRAVTHQPAYLSTSRSTGTTVICDCSWTRHYDTHAAAERAAERHQNEQESR